MKPEDVKIVFPLDVSTLDEARALMKDVGNVIDLPKVGLELTTWVGHQPAIAMCKDEYGKAPFDDIKLNDIPNTVKGAAKALTAHGAAYFNVMASGGRPMMEAAMEGAAQQAKEMGIERPKVIAVTVLTSLKIDHLVELGICPPKFLLLRKAEQEAILAIMSEKEKQSAITEITMLWSEASVRAGVDIILSSAKESAAIHQAWPEKILSTPGIRLPDSPPDDQGPTLTPGEAACNGSRYLVIGRPIRNPEGGKTRQQVVEEIREDIRRSLLLRFPRR